MNQPTKKNFTIYLNAGHSGIDKDGKYLTAPSKMFKHTKGNFHNGTTFYEGVSNRRYANRLSDMLKTAGIDVVQCFDDVLDLPLANVTNMANRAFKSNIQNDAKHKGLFISLHSDASDGTARGLACWTSEKATTSAFIAGIMSNHFSKDLSSVVKIRPNRIKSFYVVKNTSMPAVLIENLFFDNYDDAEILMSESYLNAFCNAVVNAVIEYL